MLNTTQAATHIRPATPDDAAAIAHVAATTWRATYRGHLADEAIEQFLARNYSVEALGRTIGRLGQGAMAAVQDEAVVGYAFTGRNHDEEWELFALYVLPTVQGSGAGRALWTAATRHACGAGAASVCLWVLRDNPAARGFYAQMGAAVVAQRSVTIGGQEVVNVQYRVDRAASER